MLRIFKMTTMSTNVGAMFSVREKHWHGFGTIIMAGRTEDFGRVATIIE